MPEKYVKDLFFPLIFSLLFIIVFALGYFTANLVKQDMPAIVIERATVVPDYNENQQSLQEGEVVASVNSDKFHFLNCSGAKTIKKENKIYFKSAQEAISAGFILAGNCRF